MYCIYFKIIHKTIKFKYSVNWYIYFFKVESREFFSQKLFINNTYLYIVWKDLLQGLSGPALTCSWFSYLLFISQPGSQAKLLAISLNFSRGMSKTPSINLHSPMSSSGQKRRNLNLHLNVSYTFSNNENIILKINYLKNHLAPALQLIATVQLPQELVQDPKRHQRCLRVVYRPSHVLQGLELQDEGLFGRRLWFPIHSRWRMRRTTSREFQELFDAEFEEYHCLGQRQAFLEVSTTFAA